MKFDLSTLAPLALSLTKASLPTLAKIAGGLLPPPLGLLAGPVIEMIAGQFGVDASAPDAPSQIAAKIDADPVAATARLQPMESARKVELDAAEAELEARLRDVQDARATEVQLVKTGSSIQWAAPVVSVATVVGFIVIAALVLSGHVSIDASPLALMIVGAMISNNTTVVQFWLGSSQSSRDKDETIAKAVPRAAPAVVAAPVRKAGR